MQGFVFRVVKLQISRLSKQNKRAKQNFFDIFFAELLHNPKKRSIFALANWNKQLSMVR